MKELYDLKDMLCDELAEYGKKELTAGSLDVVDKLSHALKSVTTIIAMEEADGEYSGTYPMNGNGTSYRMNGSSYAGRRGARRDRMGRYSREAADDMVEQLRGLMEDAPDERMKGEIHRLISKFEKM